MGTLSCCSNSNTKKNINIFSLRSAQVLNLEFFLFLGIEQHEKESAAREAIFERQLHS